LEVVALIGIVLAVTKMEEAEEAALEAICDKLDVEVAAKTTEK
jgi:hypothetical protein